MAKKKLTVNQQQWKKEVNRLKQFIRRAEKRGFTFDDIIPETPKRITKKQLNLIKSLTPNVLYSRSQYTDPQTGQSMTGTEGRRLERSKAAQKAVKTKQFKNSDYTPPEQDETILRMVEDMIKAWAPYRNWSKYFFNVKSEDMNRLVTLLYDAISQFGRKEVARRLQAEADTVIEICDRILYSSDIEKVDLDLTHFATILKGSPLTQEESAYFTNLAESYNEGE